MLFRMLWRWFKRRQGGRDATAGDPDRAPGGAAGAAGTVAGTGSASPPPSIERGARAMSLELQNVVAVARREYMARARTRTFRLTTVLLVVASIGLALAPVLIRWIDRGSGPTQIEVAVGNAAPSFDVAARLQALLNAQTGAGQGGSNSKYTVTATTDVAGATSEVDRGHLTGLLIVSRAAGAGGQAGDLQFTFVTKAKAVDPISQLMRVDATSIGQADRAIRAGLSEAQLAALGAPAAYVSQLPNGTTDSSATPEGFVNNFAVGFVLAIILFMAIILYGQWVAYSVAEEKSSRVMEVILGAASPLELLAGKVAGVGGLALTQYAIIFVPALVLVLLQDQISSLLLGEPAAAASLPPGLSVQLLVTWGVLFILGFALYSVLYAGAAALVSRTEDINAIVAPMTLISTAGYLVAVYSSTGLISPESTFVHVMALIPFFSPYLVLSLMGQNAISGVEVVAAIVLLAVFVPIALWVAARLYAAGVLMYGQRPGLKLLTHVLRGS